MHETKKECSLDGIKGVAAFVIAFLCIINILA